MRFACLAAGLAACLAPGPGLAEARGYHGGGYGGGHGYPGGYGYRGGFGYRAGPPAGLYGPRSYGYGYGPPPAYLPPPVIYAPPRVLIPGANPYPPAGANGGYMR